MESDFSDVKEVNGINLDNYFPYRSSFDTVVYVHKRFLKKPRKAVQKEEPAKNKSGKKNKTGKEDKAISCNIKDSKSKKDENSDPVLQQTIKFAKGLVPLVIPPSEGSNTPVFYTIKTCGTCKKNGHPDGKCEKRDDITFEKKRSKKLKEIYKKEKKHKESNSEFSATRSSQSNTLDDINMNQSLSCTASELSDKREKYHKNELNNKRKRQDLNKLCVSESFEGLATELNNNGETKIKIHLMNDREKYFLSESIRVPVLDAIKNCLTEFNANEVKEDLTSVQRIVKCNSRKLDVILDKLASIENHLANTNARTPRSPKPKVLKPSKLEQLEQDIIEDKESSSDDELSKTDSNRQNADVPVLAHGDRTSKDIGCKDLTENRASTSVGVRTERHRLPARFCWTDTA